MACSSKEFFMAWRMSLVSPLKNEGTNSMFLVKENEMFVITLKATKAFLVHFFNAENWNQDFVYILNDQSLEMQES